MQSIYLMPFTAKSVLLFHALIGEDYCITGFLDNDSSISGMQYMGCRISVPSSSLEANQEALIILCEPRHYEANIVQLNQLGCLYYDKLDRWLKYDAAILSFAHVDKDAFEKIVPQQAKALKTLPYRIQQVLLPHFNESTDALVIDALDLVVTQKCSLRCKKCANLMQYYANPQDMSLEQIYNDIDLIFTKVDWIRDLYVFGGEAFLYKQFAQVLRHLMPYRQKYGLLATITNGTVLPSDDTLQALKDSDMYVYVSDYGERSRKVNELTDKLELYHIPYQRSTVNWFDYMQLVDGDSRGAEHVFSLCKLNCSMLRNGLLYRCPFLANAEALHAIPYSENNHLDISKSDVTKSDIASHLAKPDSHTKDAPPGCAFCSGYDVGNMRETPAAEQARTPLPYKQYETVR